MSSRYTDVINAWRSGAKSAWVSTQDTAATSRYPLPGQKLVASCWHSLSAFSFPIHFTPDIIYSDGSATYPKWNAGVCSQFWKKNGFNLIWPSKECRSTAECWKYHQIMAEKLHSINNSSLTKKPEFKMPNRPITNLIWLHAL